jgi:hypothetical protein
LKEKKNKKGKEAEYIGEVYCKKERRRIIRKCEKRGGG